MGPQASLRFHQLLIEKSARYHNGDGDQFPHIVHFSLPVADFISDESARHTAAQTLNQLAPTIKSLHPGQITLACNTAHAMTADVGMLQQAPFISMLEVVAAKLESDNIQKVGLLASPTTIRTKLYANVLTAHGIIVVEPTGQDQRTLERVIRAVISGTAGKLEERALERVAHRLVVRGAEALLLGCTELPLIFNVQTAPAPTYDCLDLYADAVITEQYCIMEAR
jgi:aspartate racemase